MRHVPAFFTGGEIPIPGNDSFTKALLHMDGANGGTSFTDSNSGGAAKTWTATGSAVTSASLFKFGSAAFSQPTSTSSLSTPYLSEFSIAGNFTVDLWVNLNGASYATATGRLASLGNVGGTNGQIWNLTLTSSGTVEGRVILAGSFVILVATTLTVPTTGWHHIAYVRNGSSYNVYIDGVGATATVDSSSPAGATGPLAVGSSFFNTTAVSQFIGFIDEFRYSVGVARWTGNFSPPTGPYF